MYIFSCCHHHIISCDEGSLAPGQSATHAITTLDSTDITGSNTTACIQSQRIKLKEGSLERSLA